MPGAVPGAKNTKMSKAEKVPTWVELTAQSREIDNNQMMAKHM